MAIARKCNRCGKCFDPLDHGRCYMVQFSNPVFMTSEDIHKHNAGYYLVSGHPDEKIDLCPDCTEDFQAFMEGNPLALRKNDFDRVNDPLDPLSRDR